MAVSYKGRLLCLLQALHTELLPEVLMEAHQDTSVPGPLLGPEGQG